MGCVGQYEEMRRHALSALLRRRGHVSMRVYPRGARVMEGLKAGGAVKEGIDGRGVCFRVIDLGGAAAGKGCSR